MNNILDSNDHSKYVKPTTVSAYAEILKIYYPKGVVPKFSIVSS